MPLQCSCASVCVRSFVLSVRVFAPRASSALTDRFFFCCCFATCIALLSFASTPAGVGGGGGAGGFVVVAPRSVDPCL